MVHGVHAHICLPLNKAARCLTIHAVLDTGLAFFVNDVQDTEQPPIQLILGIPRRRHPFVHEFIFHDLEWSSHILPAPPIRLPS